MASEKSSLSQCPLITSEDEFEWLEMTEFDASSIKELLYEPIQEAESLMQDAEVADGSPAKSLAVENNYWCFDAINELENFNWPDVVEEEISAPCNDDWYGEPCMEVIDEVLEIGDYDDIGYIGLWQESYD